MNACLPYPRPRMNLVPPLLALAAFVIVLIMLYLWKVPGPEPDYWGLIGKDQIVFSDRSLHHEAAAANGIVEGTHADGHIEIDVIRRCLKESGPYMVYKARHHDTWYLVCRISDSFWAFQAVTRDGFEKTGFSPGDQSLQALRNYLEQFCTRYKSPLPWLSRLVK